MIRLQSLGYRGLDIRPVFSCDVCNQLIADIQYAAAVYRNDGVGEGELLTVLHVHKGSCHDEAERRFAGEDRAPWAELADHVEELLASVGDTFAAKFRKLRWGE